MTVNTAEDLVLPVTMTMKGSESALSMTVNRSGQEIKIKPDTYDITKAVDGSGKCGHRRPKNQLLVFRDSDLLSISVPEIFSSIIHNDTSCKLANY